MSVRYVPKPLAKEAVLKNEPGVREMVYQAARTVQSTATSRSAYGGGKHYKYNANFITNSKGFPQADVFISWKRKSGAFENALNILRDSL